jgi:hypothetical protein
MWLTYLVAIAIWLLLGVAYFVCMVPFRRFTLQTLFIAITTAALLLAVLGMLMRHG